MKKIVCSVSLTVAFMLVCSAGLAADYKLGYVSIQKAVSDSIAGKEAMEQFAGEVKRMEESLLKEKEEIEKLGEVIQKQSMMLTDEVRREKEKDFLRRKRDYERQVEDSKTEIQIKEAELTNDILEDLIPIVKKYGEDNKYSIIFEKNDRTLLYVSEALDLTDKIMAIYDKQYQKQQ